MQPRAIDFIVYNVEDMGRSVRFYREVLGIDAPFNEEGGFWTDFDTSTVSFALCRPSKDRPWTGPAALALAVRDIHEAIAELRAKGVKVLTEPEETNVCFMAFIEDPDGNRICIHQRKDGTAGKQPANP